MALTTRVATTMTRVSGTERRVRDHSSGDPCGRQVPTLNGIDHKVARSPYRNSLLYIRGVYQLAACISGAAIGTHRVVHIFEGHTWFVGGAVRILGHSANDFHGSSFVGAGPLIERLPILGGIGVVVDFGQGNVIGCAGCNVPEFLRGPGGRIDAARVVTIIHEGLRGVSVVTIHEVDRLVVGGPATGYFNIVGTPGGELAVIAIIDDIALDTNDQQTPIHACVRPFGGVGAKLSIIVACSYSHDDTGVFGAAIPRTKHEISRRMDDIVIGGECAVGKETNAIGAILIGWLSEVQNDHARWPGGGVTPLLLQGRS